MCDESDQQVRQMTQRSAQGGVDPLGAGIRSDLGGQTRQQSLEGLRPVALQGPDAPVELALGTESREVASQVGGGEAPEVSLAAKARPLSQDRQGEYLRVGEQGRTARMCPVKCVNRLMRFRTLRFL